MNDWLKRGALEILHLMPGPAGVPTFVSFGRIGRSESDESSFRSPSNFQQPTGTVSTCPCLFADLGDPTLVGPAHIIKKKSEFLFTTCRGPH
jgi:hypothetical protein